MANDLWSIRFDLIKEWQEMNALPLVQRFYLFAGLGGTSLGGESRNERDEARRT